MGIEPTHAEIALRLNVDEHDVVEMDHRLSASDASLDASVGESDGRQTTRMDLLTATAPGPDHSPKVGTCKAICAGQSGVIFVPRLLAKN